MPSDARQHSRQFATGGSASVASARSIEVTPDSVIALSQQDHRVHENRFFRRAESFAPCPRRRCVPGFLTLRIPADRGAKTACAECLRVASCGDVPSGDSEGGVRLVAAQKRTGKPLLRHLAQRIPVDGFAQLIGQQIAASFALELVLIRQTQKVF